MIAQDTGSIPVTEHILQQRADAIRLLAYLYSDDGSLVPVAQALKQSRRWFEHYEELWGESGGSAQLVHGGLLIEVRYLPWYLAPRDWVIGRIAFWAYPMLELMQGVAQAKVWAWEESSLTAALQGNELTLEELHQGSGFVFYPRRCVNFSRFAEELLREIRLVCDYRRSLLGYCRGLDGSCEFEAALARDLGEGLDQTSRDFEAVLRQWQASLAHPT